MRRHKGRAEELENAVRKLFLEDEELVADEIPGHAGDTSERRTQEPPLLMVHTAERRDRGEDERCEKNIDEETDDTDDQELDEFLATSFGRLVGEDPVFVPEETVEEKRKSIDPSVEGIQLFYEKNKQTINYVGGGLLLLVAAFCFFKLYRERCFILFYFLTCKIYIRSAEHAAY